MYPKKRPKTDREKFYEAFGKKVGCKPELSAKLTEGLSPAAGAYYPATATGSVMIWRILSAAALLRSQKCSSGGSY